ncbi:methyltransferase domain-containing protein [Persicobacter diffluens]|uniref:Methyltransferase type 11 domain-containing protein n=1 Tax=Persicobacter diffluens TaxID=981 RepID=A0AAN4W393_9BACT|nr:hypothetical protein PEDI_37370 [Persicobacter diffluens]
MFSKVADNSNPQSMASKSRRKRFDFFLSKLNGLGKPVKILDVGGTEKFWKAMNFTGSEDIEIYLLNLEHQQVSLANFKSLKGDATDLSEFENNFFDVVFSNSVIEHLFSWENQQKMAHEIQRVGRYHFIQTPNYWFPLEPHFVFPFFQYLPKSMRVNLTQRFDLGHIKKAKDKAAAESIINEIQLLSIGQMKNLFPQSDIYLDKIMGLNKSIVAHNFPQ